MRKTIGGIIDELQLLFGEDLTSVEFKDKLGKTKIKFEKIGRGGAE